VPVVRLKGSGTGWDGLTRTGAMDDGWMDGWMDGWIGGWRDNTDVEWCCVVDRLGGPGLTTLARARMDGLEMDLISSVEGCPVWLGRHWVGGLERRYVPPALHRNFVGTKRRVNGLEISSGSRGRGPWMVDGW
jgi:hypothetical protein